jgi:Matrixin
MGSREHNHGVSSVVWGRMGSDAHMKVLVHRRRVFICLSLLLFSACIGQHGAAPVYGGGGGSPWSKVPTVVFVAPETDPRLQVAREAVDFWNRTFAELSTPFRLGPISHTTDTVSIADLKALSVQVVGRGGPTALPEHIQRMPGDLIVVLSDGDFISFAARSLSGAKVLVGIRSHQLYPLTLPNVARNVIAHELGHAIGLGHNDDPTTLMCGRLAPCRPAAFQSQTERFFPLTNAEKARLMTMYPPHWQSR